MANEQSDKDERAEALVIAERWKDDPPSSLPPARALGILARAFLAADEDRRVAQGQAMMMESAARTVADKLDTPLPECGERGPDQICTVYMTLEQHDRWTAFNAAPVSANGCIRQEQGVADTGARSTNGRSQAAKDIAAERERQIAKEGWDAAHDDEHDDRQLATAAHCYLAHYIGRSWVFQDRPEVYRKEEWPSDWPWHEDWWKPKSPRADLIRAAALIAAEIDRIDRAALSATGERS